MLRVYCFQQPFPSPKLLLFGFTSPIGMLTATAHVQDLQKQLSEMSQKSQSLAWSHRTTFLVHSFEGTGVKKSVPTDLSGKSSERGVFTRQGPSRACRVTSLSYICILYIGIRYVAMRTPQTNISGPDLC